MPNGHITRRVIVKFHDTVDIPYEDGAERHVVRLGIGPWTELEQRFKGIRLNRLFTVMSASSDQRAREAGTGTRRALPARESPFVFRDRLAGRRRSPGRSSPHSGSGNGSRSRRPTSTRSTSHRRRRTPIRFFAQQTYLKPPATAAPPAPQGAIDAEFAWTQPGGTGTDQKIVDLERGAKLDQEDIVGRNIGPQLHGINNPDFFDQLHGAQVLCIVAAMDNAKGVIGIAHGVQEVKYTCQVIDAAGPSIARTPSWPRSISHSARRGSRGARAAARGGARSHQRPSR